MANITTVSSKKEARNIAYLLKELIKHHEDMKNSFFWESPSSASSRRNYEANKTRKLHFIFKYWEADLKCSVTCSANNIYYKGEFYINNQKKTIIYVKNILKEMERFISTPDNKKTLTFIY